MVELRESRHGKMLWDVALDELLLGVVAEELVEYVVR